jgi:hypothetical protein
MWAQLCVKCSNRIAKSVCSMAWKANRVKPGNQSIYQIVQFGYVVRFCKLAFVQMQQAAQSNGTECDHVVDVILDIRVSIVSVTLIESVNSLHSSAEFDHPLYP